MKKLLLIDGNSVLFRAYFATAYGQRMTSSKGIPTNAIFGFANMIQKAIDLIQPDSILVAFDAGKHTFRHEIYAEYKDGRNPAPDDLVPQFSMARDYLDAFAIRWVEMKEIEADDLIGTMAKQSLQFQTTILSSDRDLLQLIDSTTTVLLMKKGLSDIATMTQQRLYDEMGITPQQIIDMKALMGDKSDNIPGIMGIGEKTALKLLAKYHTVENVLANVQNMKGALAKNIQHGHDSALLSKKLATILTEAPIDFTADECAFKPNYQTLIQFFESLDMNSLVKKYQTHFQVNSTIKEDAKIDDIPYQMFKCCPKNFYTGKQCSLYIDENFDTFYHAKVYGVAIYNGQDTIYMKLNHVKQDSNLLEYLLNVDNRLIGFDVKRNLHLCKKVGLQIQFHDDAMISASLVDSTLTTSDKIWKHFSLSTTQSHEEIYGKPNKPKPIDEAEQIRYACECAENIAYLFQATYPKLIEFHMEHLYYEIEIPLTTILYHMEDTGIRCDIDILNTIAEDMKKQIEVQQSLIYQLAKKEFNINSPKQLAEVLYDDLGLPSGKKRSTSAEILEGFIDVHEIAKPLLAYRKLQKIYSTYAQGLQKYILEDGKIHTIYNQSATQTGRLSSSEPNLQNISVKDEQGKEIRKAFLPEDNCVLISSDYHQIELRILAHMANETNLISAFHSGIDIHTKTAMDIFDVSQEEVDALMRRRAKTVNFGIVYGISDFGLAQQLQITRYEASIFTKKYYEKFPKIRSYMNSLIIGCEENGYVETLCGRRREIPEIKDRNHMVREFGKRAAMNAPIQGTAADLIKIAMIRADRMIKDKKLKSKMILQVHDELIFNVPNQEIEVMKEIIDEAMEHAMELSVPLTTECAIGHDWYEAK